MSYERIVIESEDALSGISETWGQDAPASHDEDSLDWGQVVSATKCIAFEADLLMHLQDQAGAPQMLRVVRPDSPQESAPLRIRLAQ